MDSGARLHQQDVTAVGCKKETLLRLPVAVEMRSKRQRRVGIKSGRRQQETEGIRDDIGEGDINPWSSCPSGVSLLLLAKKLCQS